MNTKPDTTEELSDEQLTSKLADIIMSADRMVTLTLANTTAMGASPISTSAKMFVAGIMAEVTTHPHESIAKLRKEMADVMEAIFDSLELVNNADEKTKSAVRMFSMREKFASVMPKPAE